MAAHRPVKGRAQTELDAEIQRVHTIRRRARAAPGRHDPRYFGAMLDSNALGGTEYDADVERVIELAELRQLSIVMPASVKDEIEHPHTPVEVKRRAARLIFTLKVQLTSDEKRRSKAVRAILQGNAKAGQHDRDALHLFEAMKYGCGYFITNDKRLISRADELRTVLSYLEITTPAQFLETVDSFPPRGRPETQ